MIMYELYDEKFNQVLLQLHVITENNTTRTFPWLVDIVWVAVTVAVSTQLNVYSPIKETKDTEVIQQMHGRLPERPKPIYAGHPWL